MSDLCTHDLSTRSGYEVFLRGLHRREVIDLVSAKKWATEINPPEDLFGGERGVGWSVKVSYCDAIFNDRWCLSIVRRDVIRFSGKMNGSYLILVERARNN